MAVTAMSPIDEELVSIPLGLALGLPAWHVALLSLAFNYLPVAVISLLFKFGEKNARLMAWLTKLRSRRLQKLLDKHGIAAVILVTLLTGVYITTASLELAGMNRAKIHLGVICGLVFYCVLLTFLSIAGIRLLR